MMAGMAPAIEANPMADVFDRAESSCDATDGERERPLVRRLALDVYDVNDGVRDGERDDTPLEPEIDGEREDEPARW